LFSFPKGENETALKDIKSKGKGQKAKIKNGKDRRDGGLNGIF
jgi:hypothetical protein